MDGRLIFLFPSIKSGILMDRKWYDPNLPYQGQPNKLSVRHENIDYCRTGIVLEVSCFYFASGAAYIREFMSHRLQNRIHHNESSIYRLRSTSTSEWFQLSRPAINKKASQTRCLTLPLCVAEVYTLRCDAMRAGTSHCPLHRPSTTNWFGARNRLSDKGCHPFYEFPYWLCKIHAKLLSIHPATRSTSSRGGGRPYLCPQDGCLSCRKGSGSRDRTRWTPRYGDGTSW